MLMTSPTRTSPTGTTFTRLLGVAALIGIVWLVVFGLWISPDDQVQKQEIGRAHV